MGQREVITDSLFMKLFIANVGVNSSDAAKKTKKRSPIFPEGTFEFIPIKERRENSKYTHHKYSTLPCFNNRKRTLSYYIDSRYSDFAVHNDPEFVTFTYGDVDTARGSNLKRIAKDDVLLFLARLYDCRDGSGFMKSSRFYFIGYITVDYVVEFKGGHPQSRRERLDQIKNNAHFIRLSNGSRGDFRIIRGKPNRSHRFKKALEVTPYIAGLAFNGRYDIDSDLFISKISGEPVLNKNGKPTSFKFFHSKTRTVQSYLDSDVTSEKKSLDKLLRTISMHCL